MTLTGEGRLGTDVRTTELARGARKGEPMATARVACHVPRTGSGGGNSTEVLWLRLVAIGDVAKSLEGRTKGSQLAFRGTLKRNSYNRRDGTDGSSWECAVESVADERTGLPGGAGRGPPGRA